MSLQTWHDQDGNLKPFKWDVKKTRAAGLLAEGLSRPKVADQVGVSVDVLKYWTRHPDFGLRVQKILDDYAREVASLAIASRAHRLEVLNDMESRLLEVVDERASDPGNDPHTGQHTGTVVKRERVTQGRNGTTVETEYQVDTGTISEIRALHKQAAQELGQWSEKSEVELSGGIERVYVLEDDEGNELVTFDIEDDVAALREAGEA